MLALALLGCPPSPVEPAPVLSDEELRRRFDEDVESLGPVSVGRPDAGALINGMAMPKGERWEIFDPSRAWATQETIDYLVAAIDAVHEKYPGTEPLI